MNFGFKKQLLLLVLFLGIALVLVFDFPAFMPTGNTASLPFLNPSQMLFDNDNPLGAQKAEMNREPNIMTGMWGNLNWVGGHGVSDSPRISSLTSSVLGPELFVKYYPFLTMMFLGFSAWLLFRTLDLSPMVCLFGGFAAGINMHCFSVAVWGLSQWDIAIASMFLAIAALMTKSIKQWWARALLAGGAVGLVIMEGFDAGAILSIYIGIFILFAGWHSDGPMNQKIVKTGITAALVIAFSALVAAHTLDALIGTQIKGVAGVEQNASKLETPAEIEKSRQEKERRWSFCTQWSLPKLETLRLFIPGLMGYHMYENVDGLDKSSSYWGRIGEDLGLTAIQDMRKSPNPEVRRQADEAMRTFGGYRRHIGSGDYAGLLVMILAAFATVNALRGTAGPFTEKEKRFVWFWAVAALLSLILAYGRHAFLYGIVFELPYFSTTRNPIKFLHPFFVCVLILSAYGAEALWRNYLRGPVRAFGQFEKRWTYFGVGAIVISIFGLFVLVSKKEELVHYLSLSGVVSGTEPQLASFCIGEVVWYVFFLIASVGVLTLILRGTWSAKQAKWAWIAMGALLLFDVGRSDRYWLKYYNYKEKYALNKILDFLHQEPYEKKSTAKLMPFGHYDISACPAPRKPYDNNFYAVCNEWLQNQFPYYNIQAVDIVQAPRTPEMDNNMASAFTPRTSADLPLCARLWQLTNTRYIFCWAGFMDRPPYQGGPTLRHLDPSGDHFVVRARLNVTLSPGVTVPTTSSDLSMEIADDGEFALVEYTNTLPRVKLYSNWQTIDSVEATLSTLRSMEFDPQKKVLIAKETPVAAPTSINSDPGTVKIESYHPKYLKMQANANAGSVLLLNERYSPYWRVLVDGKAAPLLQCNYLMKGVYLEKGQHTVEFKFRPPNGSLYVTLAGWGIAILVAGFVIITNRRNGSDEPSAPAATKSSTPERA